MLIAVLKNLAQCHPIDVWQRNGKFSACVLDHVFDSNGLKSNILLDLKLLSVRTLRDQDLGQVSDLAESAPLFTTYYGDRLRIACLAGKAVPSGSPFPPSPRLRRGQRKRASLCRCFRCALRCVNAMHRQMPGTAVFRANAAYDNTRQWSDLGKIVAALQHNFLNSLKTNEILYLRNSTLTGHLEHMRALRHIDKTLAQASIVASIPVLSPLLYSCEP